MLNNKAKLIEKMQTWMADKVGEISKHLTDEVQSNNCNENIWQMKSKVITVTKTFEKKNKVEMLPLLPLSSSIASGSFLAGIRNLSLAIFRESSTSGSFGSLRLMRFRFRSFSRSTSAFLRSATCRSSFSCRSRRSRASSSRARWASFSRSAWKDCSDLITISKEK